MKKSGMRKRSRFFLLRSVKKDFLKKKSKKFGQFKKRQYLCTRIGFNESLRPHNSDNINN